MIILLRQISGFLCGLRCDKVQLPSLVHSFFQPGLGEHITQPGTKQSTCIINSVNLCKNLHISSVHWFSYIWLFVTPWTAARQASLSITNPWSLLKLITIELVMPSNHLILWRPLLLLPSVFPSIRVFSKESVLGIRWLKYWSLSFSISPSNEYSGLISFRIDWLDLLADQGTLKSLLQHRSSKASISLALSFLYRPTLTSIHDYRNYT